MVSARWDRHCPAGCVDLGPLAFEFKVGVGYAGRCEHDDQRRDSSDDVFGIEAADSVNDVIGTALADRGRDNQRTPIKFSFISRCLSKPPADEGGRARPPERRSYFLGSELAGFWAAGIAPCSLVGGTMPLIRM